MRNRDHHTHEHTCVRHEKVERCKFWTGDSRWYEYNKKSFDIQVDAAENCVKNWI